ncbi:Immunoglobulin-like fold [Phytophthora cinnamomi]|uniref:Immunoglobulin-like fold n=1 Tax=Phytophthora cinnamomi TaxID=4785 RepID=UPI00355AB246|nr:Immunoglobulin-like fold [Phytophthora cinnamomi]
MKLEMALEQLLNVDSVGVARSPYSAAMNGFVFDGANAREGHPSNRALSFEGSHFTGKSEPAATKKCRMPDNVAGMVELRIGSPAPFAFSKSPYDEVGDMLDDDG